MLRLLLECGTVDMQKIVNFIGNNYEYQDMNINNPLKPLVIWSTANTLLDDFIKDLI